jgi:uncharacterized 2Fe-2S/4Fe-4S cluster protein (DUF4445 family)
MHKINFGPKILLVPNGTILSEVLFQAKEHMEHPCGGRGICKKCLVRVNGEEELACQYRIDSDITVEIPEAGELISETGIQTSERLTNDLTFVLDLGTTTLAMALVSLNDRCTIRVKTSTNPQRTLGADIMTRIDFCRRNGAEKLKGILIEEINSLISSFGVPQIERLYVAGNTTMLHLLLGVDCSTIGVAPYTPAFLSKQCRAADDVGVQGVRIVELLPSIAAFVGADLVAGLNCVEMPEDGKYSLLVDLGTNAEILLFSKESILCTAAAAGPCFEGANISCGMSATRGAIFAYADGAAQTIESVQPKGICGTGLFDVVAELLRKEIVDATGFMEEGSFAVAPNIQITQGDIRQFQLAKAAVCAGIQTLMQKQGVESGCIDTVYISGGFSAKINLENAIRTGLIPEELGDKCKCINNSCLQGAVRYACEQNNLEALIKQAVYVDLSSDSTFADLFVSNMLFPGDDV